MPEVKSVKTDHNAVGYLFFNTIILMQHMAMVKIQVYLTFIVVFTA